ncbi:MAG: DsrE family protein [Actinomycetota bacterium]|nr:DsrE family protein [Actinomycetota bacterium]
MAGDSEGKLLIIQSSGVDEPKRTYAPLFFAVTAKAMDLDVTIWFTMKGATQVVKGAAEKIELVKGSGITLKTWLDRCKEEGVELLACHQALEVEGLTEDDLIEGVEMAGAASIVDMTFEADRVLCF